MKVDVTIATKNSASTIERCIECIKLHIPYNRIIVIDDSEDQTAEIAERLGCEVYHVPALLGVKRFKQAELAETEWVASIDSDVFVYPNWWSEISSYLKQPDVGAISGYLDSKFVIFFPEYDKFTKYIAMQIRKIIGAGPIGNTLIRRNIVLECTELLKNVHGGEDTIIGRFVREKGYKWVTVEKPIGLHFHEDPVGHNINASYRGGVSKRIRFGFLLGIMEVLKTPLINTFFWLKYSKQMRTFNFSLYFFLVHLSLVEFIGFLH